jgi:hypothetical protein
MVSGAMGIEPTNLLHAVQILEGRGRIFCWFLFAGVSLPFGRETLVLQGV